MDRTTIATCLLAACLACGCAPRSNSPNSVPGAASNISNVARTTAPARLVLGDQSCASSGCHGRAFDGVTRDWRSAYTIWDNEDPHRRAFEVLYTERSIEMFRKLHPDRKQSAEPPADAEYAAFLSQRCLGCHATGLRGRDVVALADARDVPEYYLAGVSCESCHGPASAWLHTHYLQGFSRTSPGFVDTKNLQSKAAQCVGCHVGPMIAESGRAYDMNHDLIAAGHPRLAFELSTYLANYPKHWKDDSRTSSSAAWAAGQEQAARQLTRQIVHRLQAAKRAPNEAPWPDFSNFDCFDCHHTLREPGHPRPRAAHLAGRRGVPRPALLPLTNLRLLAGDNPRLAEESQRVEQVLTSSWLTPIEKLVQPPEDELSLLTSNEGDALVANLPATKQSSRHLAILQAILGRYRRDQAWELTWDEGIQFYLAVAALVRDLGPAGDQLRTANDLLAQALGPESFGSAPPLPYDSPTSFDPARLNVPLDQIVEALNSLATKQTNETR